LAVPRQGHWGFFFCYRNIGEFENGSKKERAAFPLYSVSDNAFLLSDLYDVQYQYFFCLAVSLVHFANQARAFQSSGERESSSVRRTRAQQPS
jgi:hypothetical protein